MDPSTEIGKDLGTDQVKQNFVFLKLAAIMKNQYSKMPKQDQLALFESVKDDCVDQYVKDAFRSLFKDLLPQSIVHHINVGPGIPIYPPLRDYEKLLTTGEAKKLLNLSSVNTIKNRIDQLALLGMKPKNSHAFKIPACQFHDGKVVQGVDDVLQLWQFNGVEAFSRMILPLQDYDGKAIIDLLREGNREAAMQAANDLK